jgi:hypothetical protein
VTGKTGKTGKVDPLRPYDGGGSFPSVEGVVRGILACPAVLKRLTELHAWGEPGEVETLRDACAAALLRRADFLARCKAGTWARDHYGIPIDE